VSNTPNTPNEPNGAQFNNLSVQGHVDIKLPEIDSAAASVGLLVTNLSALKNVLQNFSSLSGSSLNSLLRNITSQATQANAAVATLVGTTASGSSAANTTTTYAAAAGGGSAAGSTSTATGWTAQASQ
jgi:hypothetical protein